MALDMTRFIARFVEEARDHVGRLNEGLAALERDPGDAENVNAIFRSAHTVKGSSRMLKLITISETAHKLEDVLGALRENRIRFTPALGRLLLRGVDAMAALVDRVAEGAALPEPDAALCAALSAAAEGSAEAEPQPAAAPALATGPAAPPALPAAPGAAANSASADQRIKTPDTVRVRLAKLDELIKLIGEVVSSHARLRQRVVDIRQLEREAAGRSDPSATALRAFATELRDDVLAQELLMGELHDKALIMRMLPLAMVFDPAARLVRELARSLGKEVECSVVGAEIELDRQMIDRLSDPIVHLLRNAVDHGLETPAARTAAGKGCCGRIRLEARQDGGWVVIEVGDDGGGMNLAAIREKAVRKGYLGQEQAQALSDSEVVDLIFLPGFSTSPIITDVSGRGVGMDVVKRCIVDDLHGVISVETRPGAGTAFLLRLPLSLAVMRVLLCSAGGMTFGFTAQYVAELIRVPESEVLSLPERRAVVIRNEFVPVVALAPLLQLPAMERPAHILGVLLLVVQVRNEKLALVIDELLDERDMVIKPLPQHMRALTTVSGMVVTGKNELVSVLHVPALMEAARSQRHGAATTGAGAGAALSAARRHVLVVDDSLNTREIEKDVLEAHGYQVTLAEDGVEGLQKALAGRFDAVLTDVEMPGMDGFTLTARLRESEPYRHTPIVIITSRAREEDKRRGVQVGADAYIVKGDFEQTSLVETLQNLLG